MPAPRPRARPKTPKCGTHNPAANFAVAVAIGAVLAGVVAGGGLLINTLSSGDDQSKVTQLDIAGANTDPDDGLVDQLPVSAAQDNLGSGTVVPDALGDSLAALDSFQMPRIDIPDLTPRTGLPPAPGGVPSGPLPPVVGDPPPGNGSGTGASTPAEAGCPTFVAPAAVKVNTVYPGGGSSSTVPVESGTLRATRPAFGPCAPDVVVMNVADGQAGGMLGYGAWSLALDGAGPATAWPTVTVTTTKPVSATAETAGSCPTAATKVNLKVDRRTVVLVPVLTPLALGQVTATPAGAGPCAPKESVTVALDLLGGGSVSLPPGTGPSPQSAIRCTAARPRTSWPGSPVGPRASPSSSSESGALLAGKASTRKCHNRFAALKHGLAEAEVLVEF